MKISLRLIILLLFNIAGGNIIAQGISAEQRFAAGDKAYSVLQDYIYTMDFKENALAKGYDDAQAAKFKALFLPDAKIADEINHSTDMCHTDSPAVNITVEDYLAKLHQNFEEGISSRILKSHFVFDELPNKKASIYLEKSIKAKYKSSYNYEIKDTVIIALTFDDDYNSCKIADIRKLGGVFKCPNCNPCIDKHIAATAVAQNKVTAKKPEIVIIPDKPKSQPVKPEGDLSINIGAPLNTPIITTPNVANLKYDQLIPGASGLVGFKIKPIGLDFAGSLEFDLYFSKNIGLGTGLYYSYTTVQANYDTLHLSYRAVNSAGVAFLRRYNAFYVNEDIMMQNVGIPLILKTKFKIGEKLDFFFHIGGMVTFLNNAASKYNGTVDQEAIYQYRQMNGKLTEVFDPTGEVLSTDLKLTREFAMQHSNGSLTSVNNYFSENQSGFDVALGQNVQGKQKFNYKMGYGGLLRFGVNYKLSKIVSINIGANVTGLYLNGNNAYGSQLTDQLGKYNSVFGAVNQAVNISYFLNFGFQFKL